MQISRIQSQYFTNYNNIPTAKNNLTNNITNGEKQTISTHFSKIPAGYNYSTNIYFGEFFDPNRTVPHIDYEEYMAMKEPTKKDSEKNIIPSKKQ